MKRRVLSVIDLGSAIIAIGVFGFGLGGIVGLFFRENGSRGIDADTVLLTAGYGAAAAIGTGFIGYLLLRTRIRAKDVFRIEGAITAGALLVGAIGGGRGANGCLIAVLIVGVTGAVILGAWMWIGRQSAGR